MKNRSVGSIILKILIAIGIVVIVFHIVSFLISLKSVNDIINSTQRNAINRTATIYLDSVRQNLMMVGKSEEGTYYFDDTLLERGGKTFVGDSEYLFNIYQANSTSVTLGIRKAYSKIEANHQNCQASKASFVTIESINGRYNYSICMKTTDKNNRYVLATEDELKNDSNIIYKP